MTRRILVVDDDSHIREVATMALELVAGWQVVVASSGADATELAAAEAPDAILLDVMMPGVDGPATLSLLRGDLRTRHIPVVLLTAKTLKADGMELNDPATAGVIAKPFDPMTLAADVAALLGWSR
jgi:CheY-like chemotaxis protein